MELYGRWNRPGLHHHMIIHALQTGYSVEKDFLEGRLLIF